MKRAGFTVELASNGAIAIDAIINIGSRKGKNGTTHSHFDVILVRDPSLILH
jgi:hypothetical protein